MGNPTHNAPLGRGGAAPFVGALARVTALCLVENRVCEDLGKEPRHEITPFQG